MEDGWRRLNIVWISSHFHLDGRTSSRRSAELSPSAFPFEWKCSWRVPVCGNRSSFPPRRNWVAPLSTPPPVNTRFSSFPTYDVSQTCSIAKRRKRRNTIYNMRRYKRSGNYHTLKIREASLHYTLYIGREKRRNGANLTTRNIENKREKCRPLSDSSGLPARK